MFFIYLFIFLFIENISSLEYKWIVHNESMPIGVAELAAARVDNLIYIAGYNSHQIPTFDLNSMTWKPISFTSKYFMFFLKKFEKIKI